MDNLYTPRFLQVLREAITKAVKDAMSAFFGQWEVPNKLVWRIDEVADQISLSPSTIRNFLDSQGQWFDPEFPKPIRLGNGSGVRSAIGWRRTDIAAWVDSRSAHEMSHQVNKKPSEQKPPSSRGKSMSIPQS